MTAADEIISKFLDDQPFDTQELANALSDPAGRTLLIDLITLRRIVQPTDSLPAMQALRPARPFGWGAAAAAAAVLVAALAGGYLVGEQRSTTMAVEAPPPTRVVQAVPFIPPGGGQ